MKFLNIGYDNVSVYREAACPADNVNVYLLQFVLRIEDVTGREVDYERATHAFECFCHS